MTNLKQTRTKLGLSQAKMADLLGYAHQKEISYIETGQRAETPQLKKHLEALNELFKLRGKIAQTE